MERVKGLKRLISTLQNIPTELEPQLEKVVLANAKEIEANAKINAPVDTGKLQQSIKAFKIGALTFKIMANATGLAPYAIYVEHGKPIGTGPNGGPKPFLFPAYYKQTQQFIEDIENLLENKFKKI
jgi:HK97 gp10 family phage protein